MSYDFYLKQLDRHGAVKRAAVVDFLMLNYRIPVNDAGRLDVVFDAGHPIAGEIEPFDQFEVYWRNIRLGVPWHRDFVTFFREPVYSTDLDGVTTLLLKCVGVRGMLGWRHVSWAAGVANRSAFDGVAAETVMKTVVDTNLGSLATAANGRLRDGDMGPGMGWTVTTAADQGRGEVISRSFSNGNVLAIMRDTLAPIAGGDWDLEKVGPAAFEFEFYPGQRGEDKSSGSEQVLFSLLRGNLLQPALTMHRLEEATVAIAGGQGLGADRLYEIVEGPDYAPENDIELYVDARMESDSAGVIAAADEQLAAHRAWREFQFNMLQTEQVFYSRQAVAGRRTYKEGDLVAVAYQGETNVVKLKAVTVSVRPSETEDLVTVTVETEDVPA